MSAGPWVSGWVREPTSLDKFHLCPASKCSDVGGCHPRTEYCAPSRGSVITAGSKVSGDGVKGGFCHNITQEQYASGRKALTVTGPMTVAVAVLLLLFRWGCFLCFLLLRSLIFGLHSCSRFRQFLVCALERDTVVRTPSPLHSGPSCHTHVSPPARIMAGFFAVIVLQDWRVGVLKSEIFPVPLMPCPA